MVCEADRLTQFAATQPHAAYAAFTHGLASKWTFLACTIPNIEYLFQPLEDAICQRFLPALTSQNSFSDSIRDLMALPARLGGLGVTNPVKQAAIQHHTSREVTAPLVNLILEQSKVIPTEHWRNKFRSRMQPTKLEVRHKFLPPATYMELYQTPCREQ